MGFGLITGGGADGRYSVLLDWGEAYKAAILNQLAATQASLQAKILLQQDKVDAAEAREAEALASLTNVQDALIAEMQANAGEIDDSAKKLYDYLAAEYRKTVFSNNPIRAALNTLRLRLTQSYEMTAQWNNFDASDERPAWCCDLTENGSGYVATVEIPGEPNLVLIAPACREWQGWDGNISTARKNAELARLTTQLSSRNAELLSIDANLVTALAEEATLKLNVETTRLAYAAQQTAGTQAAYDEATQALLSKQVEITNLRFRRVTLTSQIAKVQLQIFSWSARPSTDNPVYGDGVMTGRQVMSPSQAYYNAAILPGWQKFKPMYRWGTASNVDYEANTMTVTLADATSSAQGLNVNAQSVLFDVPVEYMTCDAGAFEDGDRVVVQFRNQDQSLPLVIGFVDNPRACQPWPYEVVMDLDFTTTAAGLPSGNVEFGIVSNDVTCGVPVVAVSGGNLVAPEATHKLRLSAPVFEEVDDNTLYEIVLAGGTFNTDLQTWASAAHHYTSSSGSGSRVPAALTAQFVSAFTSAPANFITIQEWTNTSLAEGTWPTILSGTCVALVSWSGRAWITPFPDAKTDIINQHIVTYLESIGAMPSITVKRKSSTASSPYEFVGRDTIVVDPGNTPNSGDHMRWRMHFRRASP